MKQLLTTLILTSLLLGCTSSEPETSSTKRVATPSSTLVRTVTPIAPAAAQKETTVSGIVMSESLAKPSSKTGGVLASVTFREGQDVRRGQTLARIDATELQTGVASAEASLAKSRRDLARVEALLADSVATRTQRDDAATAVRLAEEQLAALRFNRAQNVITAPISGRIVQKLVNAGEAIGPGMPVAIIQGTASNDWRVRAGLTDAQWAGIQLGGEVSVTFAAFPGKTFPGKISERAASIDQGSGTFPIEVKLDKTPASMATGLLATVTLPASSATQRTEKMTLPLAALGTVNGKTAEVFTIVNGVATPREVSLGGIERGRVEILSGLTGTDRVITTGVAWLMAGDPVRVSKE